jgi:hypothetical protein
MPMGWDYVSELRSPARLFLSPMWWLSVESHGGIILTEENRRTRRKLVPEPLCPPQIPHGLARVWTWPLRVWSYCNMNIRVSSVILIAWTLTRRQMVRFLTSNSYSALWAFLSLVVFPAGRRNDCTYHRVFSVFSRLFGFGHLFRFPFYCEFRLEVKNLSHGRSPPEIKLFL